jgi:tRNA pseudouridine13 synthase
MFGPKMKQPTGVPAEREAKILAEAGLSLDQFRGFGDELSGTRRADVVRPGELSVTSEPDGLRFDFTLPPGVYATTLLTEVFTKNPGAGSD